MARAALEWSTADLAKKAGVGVNTINRFETDKDARLSSVSKIKAALSEAGVVFIDEDRREGVVAPRK